MRTFPAVPKDVIIIQTQTFLKIVICRTQPYVIEKVLFKFFIITISNNLTKSTGPIGFGSWKTKLVCGDQKAIFELLASFLEALVIWLTTVGC